MQVVRLGPEMEVIVDAETMGTVEGDIDARCHEP
jgi:hypothetical protein